MFSLCLMLAVAATTHWATVSGYFDRRDQPCATEKLLNAIPPDRVTWEGVIQIEMRCDPGYDWPLNKPPNGLFNCRPDGSPWDPPIFPDCNIRVVPDSMRIIYAFSVPEPECRKLALRDGSHGNNANVVLSGAKRSISFKLCPHKFNLRHCKVLKALMVCDVARNSSIESVEELGVKEPHILMVVRFDHSKKRTLTHLRQLQNSVKKSLVQQFQAGGIAGGAYSKVKADCFQNTIGVADGGVNIVCRGCSLGHYIDMKKKRCVRCPPGYYSDVALAGSCILCPALRGISNESKLWDKVRAEIRDGAYTMVLCPSFKQDDNGFMTLKKPPLEPPDVFRKDKMEALRGEYRRNGVESWLNQSRRRVVLSFTVMLSALHKTFDA